MDRVGSGIKSLGQILEKACVLSSRHSFDPICMKRCQSIWHYAMSDKIETWSSLSKYRSLDHILEKPFLHSKDLKVLYLYEPFSKCLFV